MQKNKGGRPPHEPTEHLRKKVKQHAALGVTQEDIAKVMGISADTLVRHYREELDLGMIELHAAVAGKLAAAATQKEHTAPSITAAIFYAKTRLGWKETSVNELTGPNGGPIQTVAKIEWAVIDPEAANSEGV